MSKPASTAVTALVLLTVTVAGRGQAETLRVCADPDNLPFTSSDPTEKGLYLELAALMADRIGARMEPVFFRTDAGRRALRPTLLEGRCDAFFGMPYAADGSAGQAIQLTRPFLDVGYALLAPTTLVFRGLEDLAGKSVGVQFASTPQTVLSVREGVRLATFRKAEEAVDAVGKGEIDTAFLWGPVAGYRAARRGLLGRFKIVPVTGLGLRWRAAIGVRAADAALKERLDQEITGLGPAILKLAEKYHFPLDRPVDLEAAAPVEPRARPAPPPGRTNPYRGDPTAIVAGRTQFNVHCSHCHSPNAASPDPQRDLRRLDARYGQRVDDVFYATVTQGRPTKGMPTWGPILDEDTIWKIKTFLESVQGEAPR